MIYEIYLYLTEEVTKHAKLFGHLKESISLIERQKRCQKFWKSHQDNCKSEINKFIHDYPNAKSILILGSGPLHEIPIDDFLNKFDKITLVDMVHLKQVKKKYKDYKNVEFINHDISELEDDLIQGILKNKLPKKFLDQKYDLIVSANLLSQIPNHLRKYIIKNSKTISPQDLDTFCYQTTKDHIAYLNRFTGNVLLITDIETQHIHHSTNIIEIETPYINFEIPSQRTSWIWNLAPAPEFSKDLSLQMKVVSTILK